MKIAIATATGNIGSRVARKVASTGNIPVLIGQNEDRLKKLKILEAIHAVADIGNVDQMIAATKGVDALFWLVPALIQAPSLKHWYDQVTAAGVAAVTQNKIKKVVLISSLGANLDEGSGNLAYAAEMELAFDQLDADVLSLRPGYFMENFFTQIQQLQARQQFSFLFEPDFKIPFVSTNDIGDIAAHYLSDANWAGHWKLNLMGPESISCDQASAQLSAVLPYPVRYQKGSVDQSRAMLANIGATSAVQQELTDMFQTLASGCGPYATPRTPEAYTPTTFGDFVQNKLLPLLQSA